MSAELEAMADAQYWSELPPELSERRWTTEVEVVVRHKVVIDAENEDEARERAESGQFKEMLTEEVQSFTLVKAIRRNPPRKCPSPGFFDAFSPPKTPIMVTCWHCGKFYTSDKIAWGRKRHMNAGSNGDQPLWWCPTPECDGAGFGHDIHPPGVTMSVMRVSADD